MWWVELLKWVGLIVVGYLLGSFSISRLIIKLKSKNKDDITKQGSGNPGTMNMLRNQGATMGFLTLLLDALKAIIPAVAGFYLFAGTEYQYVAVFVAGGSAVVGHIFPIFYQFKGGKGIACTLGTFFVANPIVAAIVFVLSFIFFLIVKIGSLTSFFFILVFAITNSILLGIEGSWIAFVVMWAIIILDLYAHRENIKRLITNTERRTSFQEGVKRDVERIKAKKQEKIEKVENKQNEKIEKYENKKEKLNLKMQEIEQKKEKTLEKKNHKTVKVEKKYDKKAVKTEKRGDLIIKTWENLANKLNEPEQKDLDENQITINEYSESISKDAKDKNLGNQTQNEDALEEVLLESAGTINTDFENKDCYEEVLAEIPQTNKEEILENQKTENVDNSSAKTENTVKDKKDVKKKNSSIHKKSTKKKTIKTK